MAIKRWEILSLARDALESVGILVLSPSAVVIPLTVSPNYLITSDLSISGLSPVFSGDPYSLERIFLKPGANFSHHMNVELQELRSSYTSLAPDRNLF